MLNAGIIYTSNSEWSSPIILVNKPDGSLRLCVDYRRLNAVSTFDAYPMPRIEELLERLGKADIVSTLDLTRGYWQVPVAEQDRKKTACTTPFGLYEFRTMPFGLQGAGATFQRIVDNVLRGAEEYSGAYKGDIGVSSMTLEAHLAHLRDVFLRLRQAGL